MFIPYIFHLVSSDFILNAHVLKLKNNHMDMKVEPSQPMFSILPQAAMQSTTALKYGINDQTYFLCQAAPPILWHVVIVVIEF